MAIRKAYLIDIDYTYKKGQTYVRLLVKGKRKTIRLYYPYDPYFYAEIPIERMEELLNMKAYSKEGHVVSPKDVKEAELLHGIKKKKVVKIICAQPSDIPIIRNAIPFPCYEDGISFGRRFMFDFRLIPNGIIKYEREGRVIKRIISCEQATPQLSSMAFDIETYNPQGASRENMDPVIMVSWAGKDNGGVLSTKGNSKEYLQLVRSEKEMIERFSEIIKTEDPDILFGYNSANFDIPYLRDRAKISGARFFPGRFRSALQTNKRGLNSGLKVAGRVHIDIYPMMRFFGHIGMIKTHDYKLESIANALLKNQKKQMKRLEIWKLWDEGKVDELAEYSFMDSQVTKELGEKYLGIELELSSLAKLSLYETALATSGQLVENLLMYEAAGKGMLIPPKPSGSAISERLAAPIQGAFVKLPAPGVYDNIAVLDFRGLYPSIICSYNIDPGTLLKANETENVSPDGVFVSPSGAMFLKNPKGLVPYVLDYLIDFRSEMKKKMKALDKDSDEYKMLLARSTAVKVVSNSIAGDEPLLLRDPDGNIKITNAEEFIDSRLNDEFVGNTQLGDAIGWQAACFIGNEIFFRDIKKLMRHDAQELLKLKLKSGRSIKITKDHSVFTLDEYGNIKAIKGAELNEKSIVVVPKKINKFETQENKLINIIKALAKAPDEETKELYLVTRLGQSAKGLDTLQQILEELDENDSYPAEIARKIGMQCSNIHQRMEKLSSEGKVEKLTDSSPHVFKINEKGKEYENFLKHFLPQMTYDKNSRLHYVGFNSVKNIVDRIPDRLLTGFKIGPSNGAKINPLIKITPKLGRLLGYYVSEGYSRKWQNRTGGNSYRSEIVNFNKEILDDMEECYKELDVVIQKSHRSVQSNTMMSYLIFKYVFCAGSNAYEKEVPGIILNEQTEIQNNFLLAYHLGDGCFMKKQKMYRFTTVSRKLANGLVFLLLQLGICDVTIARDTKFYRVHVWGDIPFIGHNKNKKINKHFSHSIPGKHLEKEIRQLKNIKYYYSIQGRITKTKLRMFYSEFRNKFGRSDKIENFLSLFDGDLAFDEVRSIETLKDKQLVYDLSVKDAENFIGGFGWTCLHNSFYGYLAYARSRYYSRECGESVTAYGRKHIAETIEMAEKSGFKVLYADTDSTFLLMENNRKEDVLSFMKDVNAALPEKMELELEGFYPRGLFVSKKGAGGEKGAKKKYALLGEDGRIKIRGFELVRRDWSAIAKNTQRAVLEAILIDGSKEKAVKMVRETIERINSGKVGMEDLTIVTQIRKDPRGGYAISSPELSAASKAIARGVPIQTGSVISYVITKSGKSISEKAELVEFAKDYDPAYYVNNQLLPAVMKILEELGYDEYSLKVGGKQKTLEFF